MGCVVSLTETVAAHIRRAKAADRRVRVSDFQIRVEADRTALVNLKTGAVRIIRASDLDDRFADYCAWTERRRSANPFSAFL